MSVTYKELLLAHLGQYRRDVLGVVLPGTFHYRGRDIPVEHILPKTDTWLGIPSETREEVLRYAQAHGIKLHRYFHHLNSSQAFALSLFVPFFEGGVPGANALLRALNVPGSLQEWKAEAIPLPTEGTNLDAWWRTTDGAEYFCEVKLTESEFGVASNDVAHQKKLAEIYAPSLLPHLKPRRLESEAFFQSYQILRNLWYAASAEHARVVFLYPRQHRILTDLLSLVLDDVTSSLRERVMVVHSEDVLGHLRDSADCPTRLRSYAGRLAEKYLLAAP